MYHKNHTKISIYINICCGPIVKENVVDNALIASVVKLVLLPCVQYGSWLL